MKDRRWGIAIAGLVWVVVFLLARFPPDETELLLRYAGWSKYMAVALPENFAGEVPFPVPTAILSLVSREIPVEIFWFRLPNLVFGLGWLAVMTIITPAGFGVFAALCPGILWPVMESFPMAVTLLLSAAITAIELKYKDEKKKLIWQGFLGLWLSLTGLTGWLFCLVFAGYKLAGKDFKTGGVLATVAVYAYLTAVRGFVNLPGFESALKLDQDWGSLVDQRVRQETRLTGYPEPLPLTVKRMVYNKPYFAWRAIAGSVGELFSFEKTAFPGQGEATIARSLWGSKGLSWLYFWQIPLALWGVALWKKIKPDTKKAVGIFAVWGVMGLIAGNPKDWTANGIGMIISVMILVSWLFTQMRFWQKAVVALILLISAIPTFYHFVFHEEIWRDNRPGVHMNMALAAKSNQATAVTTILGRSFLYYGWINQIHPELFWRGVQVGMKIDGIKFDHFEKPDKPGIYVGLPGEFLGNRAKDGKNDFDIKELPENRQVLDTYKIRDSVSFGNGDYIWIVKVDQLPSLPVAQ